MFRKWIALSLQTNQYPKKNHNVLCHSEVNDFLTGSHYSLFQPLGHGFLVCWACKRGKKGILSHWMNAGWIWTRMSGDFTLSQHCSLLYYFISHGKEKNILFSLAIQSNSFPANPLTPTLPSPPPPATFFATFVSFSPQNLPFLLVIIIIITLI